MSAFAELRQRHITRINGLESSRQSSRGKYPYVWRYRNFLQHGWVKGSSHAKTNPICSAASKKLRLVTDTDRQRAIASTILAYCYAVKTARMYTTVNYGTVQITYLACRWFLSGSNSLSRGTLSSCARPLTPDSRRSSQHSSHRHDTSRPTRRPGCPSTLDRSSRRCSGSAATVLCVPAARPPCRKDSSRLPTSAAQLLRPCDRLAVSRHRRGDAADNPSPGNIRSVWTRSCRSFVSVET